jgi:hypothetical protein
LTFTAQIRFHSQPEFLKKVCAANLRHLSISCGAVLAALLIVLGNGSQPGNAAEVSFQDRDGTSTIGGYRSLFLEGAIEPGDLQKLEDLSKGHYVSDVYLWSPGGDLSEALKISEFLNKNVIASNAPSPKSDSCFGSFSPKEKDNCTCASACAVIWITSPVRRGSLVGLHRPYFPQDLYKNLSTDEAQVSYDKMLKKLEVYLREQGVPNTLIDKMIGSASDEVYFLTKEDVSLVGTYKPFLDELIKSRCTEHQSDGPAIEDEKASRQAQVKAARESYRKLAESYRAGNVEKRKVDGAKAAYESELKSYKNWWGVSTKFEPYLNCPAKERRAIAEEAQGYVGSFEETSIDIITEMRNPQMSFETDITNIWKSSEWIGEVSDELNRLTLSTPSADRWVCLLERGDMTADDLPIESAASQFKGKSVMLCNSVPDTVRYYLIFDGKQSNLARYRNAKRGTIIHFTGLFYNGEKPYNHIVGQSGATMIVLVP